MDAKQIPVDAAHRLLLGAVACAMILGAAGCVSADVSCGELQKSFAGKRVAVLTIEDTQKDGLEWTVLVAGRVGERIVDRTARSLEAAFIERGYYRVADRSVIQQVMDERRLTTSEVSREGAAREIGRLAGVDGIVVVQTDFHYGWLLLGGGGRAIADVRLIDVSSGDVVWTGRSVWILGTVIPLVPFWIEPSKGLATAIDAKLAEKTQ